MGHWWKVFVASAVLMLFAALPAQAQSAADWRTCGDRSDPAAGYSACSRLLASGKLGAVTSKGFMLRAIHSSNRNDYDAAIADFTEVVRLEPTANHYFDRGLTWMLKQNYARAVEDFDQSIRLNPGVADVHYSRALAVGRGGDFT